MLATPEKKLPWTPQGRWTRKVIEPLDRHWSELSSRDFMLRYVHEPALFAWEALRIIPWDLQATSMNSTVTNVYTVVPAGHGVGKTFLAAAVAIWFLMTHPNSVVVSTAPSGPQVKLLLWAYVNSLMKQHIKPHDHDNTYDVLQQMIRVRGYEEWFAIGLSPRDEVNFHGFHREYVLVILDEAPGVRLQIFRAAQTLLTTTGARMLMIGNPMQSSGFFYDASVGRIPGAKMIRISCLKSPNLTGNPENLPYSVTSKLVSEQWVRDRAEEWGTESPLYQAKVLGEFPGSSTANIIPRDWVLTSLERSGESSAQHPRNLGVDVARHGDDQTVYATKIGNDVEVLDAESNRDLMHVAGKVVHYVRTHNIRTCCIDLIGFGAGVYDRCVELQEEEGSGLQQCAFYGVDVGKASRYPDKFPNLRSEIWFHTRDQLDPAQGAVLALPSDEALKEDLCQPEYGFDSKGRRHAEKKEDMKKRLGRSPDYADAVNLAIWGDIYAEMDSIRVRTSEPSSEPGRPRVARIPTYFRGRDRWS